MTQQGMTDAFKLQAFASNTYAIALYLGAELNLATPSYTTVGEIVATGYTAGGQTLVSTSGVTNNVAYMSFQDVSWTSDDIAADAALIYIPGSNVAVAVLDFGGVKSPNAGVFTVRFPNADATNAILRIE